MKPFIGEIVFFKSWKLKFHFEQVLEVDWLISWAVIIDQYWLLYYNYNSLGGKMKKQLSVAHT